MNSFFINSYFDIKLLINGNSINGVNLVSSSELMTPMKGVRMIEMMMLSENKRTCIQL